MLRELLSDEAQIRLIEKAANLLRKGGVVAIPTETVYGLAADASQDLAVRRLFSIKGRPSNHPLIVHISGIEVVDEWADEFPEAARRLAEKFWPGPLTLILKKKANVSDLVTGGQLSIGLRVPGHPVALALLNAFGGGLAAPSANRFSKVSPTSAQNVADDLGDLVDMILDGGPCQIGIESTIVDCTQSPPVLLRPGAITLEELEQTLGLEVMELNVAGTRSPGQHRLHYSPNARLVVAEEARLADLAEEFVQAGKRTIVLSQRPKPYTNSKYDWRVLPKELSEVAKSIYSIFREIDSSKYEVALISLPIEKGIGLALADRIRRASGQDASSNP